MLAKCLIPAPESSRIVPRMTLSDADRAILDLEREWWTRPGTKAAAIRQELGLSSSRYYRRVGQLLELPGALSYDPLTVKRLRRLRDQRRRHRYEGRRADPESR
ncbi:MAG: DUF3263 domain-containing protein [Acidimicrobiia bacterium]|nr:DUF3263 domain-containing protein [Acidimicrobiia bacterium]MCL4291885.1 DUF3263 domain-containing protein [Acidimicrobiia bacterium]